MNETRTCWPAQLWQPTEPGKKLRYRYLLDLWIWYQTLCVKGVRREFWGVEDVPEIISSPRYFLTMSCFPCAVSFSDSLIVLYHHHHHSKFEQLPNQDSPYILAIGTSLQLYVQELCLEVKSSCKWYCIYGHTQGCGYFAATAKTMQTVCDAPKQLICCFLGTSGIIYDTVRIKGPLAGSTIREKNGNDKCCKDLRV